MKKTAASILLLLVLSAGYAATKSKIDSLKQFLPAVTGHQKVDILNALGWELKDENTDEAFTFSKEAFNSSEISHYSKGLAESSRNLAALYILTNNNEEALKYADEGIQYASTLHNDYTLAKLFNIKGLILKDKYDYAEAMQYFRKSLRLFEILGDIKAATGILNNIATLYGNINEENLELETYIKVIQIEEASGNKEGLARTYNNIAGVYLSTGKNKIAKEFFRNSLSFSREISSVRYETAALSGLGLTYWNDKKYDSAIIFLQQAEALNEKNGYKQWQATNMLNLGNLYLNDLNDFKKAEAFINKAADIYQSIEDWNNFIACKNLFGNWYLDNEEYRKLARIISMNEDRLSLVASDQITKEFLTLKYRLAKKENRTSEALALLERITVLGDTISSRENLLRSYEIQAKYELQRQDLKNDHIRMNSDLNKAIIKRQQLIIIGSVLFTTLMIVIIFLAIRSRSRIKKVNLELNNISNQIIQKAVELKQANDSKDKFLSIISHDLKNPIGAITGLSELLLEEGMEMSCEERNRYLKYINDGCHSADHLLENLMKWVRSQTGKLEMKPQLFDIQNPVNDAIALVNNAAIRKEITITSEVKQGTLVYADPEMINTCVINLLSNAVKFTYPKGNIYVTPEINGKMINLSITDSGVGMSEENMSGLFKLDTKSGSTGTANEKGTGLGLLLVKEFIEKNHGEIHVKSKEGVGSTFTISVPKEPISI